MFAIITGKEAVYQNGGFFRKGYSVKEVLYSGGSYRVVSLRYRRIKWKKLAAELGSSTAHVVLCDGVKLPVDCGLVPQSTNEISYAFLKNFVRYLLMHTSVPIQKRQVTIIDLRGVYHDLARIMAKYSALLKVVTLHRESYEHLSEQLREEFGAVVQITDVIDHLSDNFMIVSPKGFDADLSGLLTVPVITLEPERWKRTETISGFSGINLDVFRLNLPPKVNQLQLAAALYDAEAHRELKNFLPGYCVLDKRKLSLQNILEERFSLDTED